jgi:hypothetical protein
MSDDFIEYELILETHNAGDQAFIKSILDSEGITYFFQGEYVAPYLFHALPMRLLVKKEDSAKARDILANMEISSAYDGMSGKEEIKDDEES